MTGRLPTSPARMPSQRPGSPRGCAVGPHLGARPRRRGPRRRGTVVGDAGDLRRDAGGDRVRRRPAGSSARARASTLRPRRRTVIRSATSKMSLRLCEMITTASPCSPSRFTRSSTWRVWATPSAAVGSSRMTSREFHITARATATDWRWPPERLATACRIERIVVTPSVFSVSRRLRLHQGSSSRRKPSWTSRPRYMFWTTSRLSQSARSW